MNETTTRLTYRDAVAKALEDSMRAEPRLMILGQNLTSHALKQLAAAYGAERVRDCPISESAMVGMAVGAAMKGMKAAVMIAYADIASVCHMAIVQSAAKLQYLTNGRLNCPVVIRLPIARFRGHGPEGNEVCASWFYIVPELNIAMPGSANEAYWIFREALNRPTPTLFFEDRSIHTRSGEVLDKSPGLRASVTRSGHRLTIIAAGRTAALAEDAADVLAQHGEHNTFGCRQFGIYQAIGQGDNFRTGKQNRQSTDRARRAGMGRIRAGCALPVGRAKGKTCGGPHLTGGEINICHSGTSGRSYPLRKAFLRQRKK